MSRGGSSNDVIDCLETLWKVLKDLESQSEGNDVLDTKLADYIFFPISHVLRQMEKLPIRARELTLECLGVLLRTAWNSDIPPALGIQLMILFTMMADPESQSSKGLKFSEELLSISFKRLEELFRSMDSSTSTPTTLIETANVPHLGKTISVILNGIQDGTSVEVQSSAMSALQAFCDVFIDREALAQGFFPGIMSALTKVLTPTTKKRRSHKVLCKSLTLLTKLVTFIFADQQQEGSGRDQLEAGDVGLSQEWIKGNAPQVKMAIGNIVKLRTHDREDVRKALSVFCFEVLQSCRKSLQESTPILLETLITLASSDDGIAQELKFHLTEATVTEASDFWDFLQSSLYSWLVSMPRVMLKADEAPKQALIRQVTLSLELLQEHGDDTEILDGMLSTTLRDSIMSAIQISESSKTISLPPAQESNLELTRAHQTASTEFEPILAIRKSQESTVLEISQFIKQLCAHPSSLSIAKDIIPNISNLSGDMQLASFWLGLNVLRNNMNSSISIDDILDLGQSSISINRNLLLDELYSFSVQVISNAATSIDHSDPRMHCLALETIALQAQQTGKSFRPELMDVLYPLLHHLGSSSVEVRQHAATALNIVAQNCGYSSSSTIVVENADYLVNDVALRLNAFDISPQAPKVLTVMVRLAGPRLLPYLDDVIEAVFVALENFHGYPRLVEMLFGALKVVVEEGVKAPALAIEDGKRERHRKAAVKDVGVEEVAEVLKGMKRKREETLEQDLQDSKMTFPHRPWKDGTDEPKAPHSPSSTAESSHSSSHNSATHAADQDNTSPAPSKPYTLLQTIATQTQHHLPSSSGTLRTSLLSLLATAAPALATHENAFLPLVHALWPVVAARLDDPEAYVVAAALEFLAVLSAQAGDFVSARVDALWPVLRRIWRVRVAPRASSAAGGGAALLGGVGADALALTRDAGEGDGAAYYVQAPARIIGEALVRMVCCVLDFVKVSDDVFDEMLEMLLPVVEKRQDVREAFEARNPDAVWLALWRLKRDKETKASDGTAKDVVRPKGRSDWYFADLV